MNCASCGAKVGATNRFCASCGAPLESAVHQETRKRVSILFLDVVGYTALAERLDPEPLRLIMDRYFAACATAITDHGGAVEKFIGDAVLAVFGATAAHEDDAARAVRAGASALGGLAELNAELDAGYGVALEARCGICTGEVVVILLPGGDFRVVGDAVNTASRLQGAAGAGEILLDADTAAMVRSVVGVEPVAPLTLKGKAHAVPAWRVTDAATATEGRPGSPRPFIGRADELEEIAHVFRRTQRSRQACLVTVLGPPGIGKSRLVRRFLGSLPRNEVTVLSGSCSAYGKGITYKPLAEMLTSYPGGWAALGGLLGQEPGPGTKAARILSTILGGQAGQPVADGATPGVDDITWAVRGLLERLGRVQPVVLVWEDLHWAEGTLLDLIDSVATWLTDVPILLLCVARTELLGSRPAWGGGKPCAMTLEVGPLTFEQSAALVAELAMSGDVYAQESPDAYLRVAGQCDGNPLFAELILDVFAENSASAAVPATIQAMLGARLDQLSGQERRLLELAAMIGPQFAPGVFQGMAAEDGLTAGEAEELTARLMRRRVLIRSPEGDLQFAQSLLRDTTYGFTPKSRRERWHAFLTRWLVAHAADPMTVACHVEAEHALRKDLRPGDPGLPALAATAAETLAGEGMSALKRHDLPAAITLLERGRELLPPGDTRHTGLALHICDSGIALWDHERPLAALAAAEVALTSDHRNAATCAIQRRVVELRLGLVPPAQVAAEASLLEASLESDQEDDLSWCRLHQLQAYLHLMREQAEAADTSMRLGLARARSMGDWYEEERLLCAICELAQWAPRNVAAGLDLCASLASRFADNRALLVPVLVTRAYLTALAGDIDEGRQVLRTALAYTGDRDLSLAHAAVMEMTAIVESLAGAHEAAEASFRRSLDVLRAARHAPDTQTTEVAIARTLFEQGQVTAAELYLEQAGMGDEVTSLRARIAADAVRMRIASARQRHDEAVAIARSTRELSTGIDDLCLAGQTLFDIAVVLEGAGIITEAVAEGTSALAKFEAKGATLLAGRVRAWLSDVTAVPGTAAG
ncbi:MAG: adenylate/guanylate cyclase [Actinomycetia bacterium]|nr:adenylate/guanylate cyclase [Actinomycetes bacterium]